MFAQPLPYNAQVPAIIRCEALQNDRFKSRQQLGNFDIFSTHQETIQTRSHRSTVWTNDKFDGDFSRKITGDVTNFMVDIEATTGGFDTAIAKRNSAIPVDKINSQTRIFSTIEVNLNGSGNWWVGPKFAVRMNLSQGLDGNYENYVVENASRSPQEYHDKFTRQGKYLGQTNHNGSVYKHYYKRHNTWGQFWAIRQNFRQTGVVNIKPILNKWRNNGLPNGYLPTVRVNLETSGAVSGSVQMSEIDIPTW